MTSTKFSSRASRTNLIKTIRNFWLAQTRLIKSILIVSLICILALIAWPEKNIPTNTPLSLLSDTDVVNFQLDLPTREESDLVDKQVIEDPIRTSSNDIVIAVKSGDTLGELFTKNSLSYSDMLSIINDNDAKTYLTRMKPGDKLKVNTVGNEGRVQTLSYEIDVENVLAVERNADNTFNTEIKTTALDVRTAYAHGVIKDSLFLAGKEAGLSDSLVMNLAGIFQWDIDFVSNIRKNDSFTVIYEQLWRDGEYLKNGKILGAEFINDGDVFHAIRFVDENDDGNDFILF